MKNIISKIEKENEYLRKYKTELREEIIKNKTYEYSQ